MVWPAPAKVVPLVNNQPHDYGGTPNKLADGRECPHWRPVDARNWDELDLVTAGEIKR